MGRLLLIHHTPSPAMQAMLEAVLSGARTDEIEGVEVVVAPALTAGADAYLLGDSRLHTLATLCRFRSVFGLRDTPPLEHLGDIS